MILVISPAKKLDMSRRLPFPSARQPMFLAESAQLVDHLRALSSIQLGQLMRLSDSLAKLNHQRFMHWQQPFSEDDATHTLAAFQGDVYQTLDAASLSAEALQFAAKHLRMLSGLYGLLRADDLMQPYRLEMGTRLAKAIPLLAASGSGSQARQFFQQTPDLYTYWRDKVTTVLAAEMKSQGTDTLINLASQEYFKVIDRRQLTARIITPVFKERYGDGYRVIGIHAKRARGLMARFIMSQCLQKVEALRDFNEAGYSYRAECSNTSEWVFARD